VDPSAGKMYWIDIDQGPPVVERVRRANLDGSRIEDIVVDERFGTRDIAIDAGGGKVYWFNRYTEEVRRANLDGSGVETVMALVPAGSGSHLCLAVGPATVGAPGTTPPPVSKLYLALGSRIMRTDTDGSGAELLVSGLTLVRGIAVDPAGGKMYWADGGADRVQRSDLDGGSIEDVAAAEYIGGEYTRGPLNPQRVVYDQHEDAVFWTDSGPRYATSGRIQRANPDGTGVSVVVTGLDLPQGIAVGPDFVGPPATTAPATTAPGAATTAPEATTSPATTTPGATPPPTTTAPPIEVTTTAPPPDVAVWDDACECASAPVCRGRGGRGAFQLTLAAEGGGAVLPAPGTTTRAAGERVRLVAIPDDGRAFYRWRVSEPAHGTLGDTPPASGSPDPSVIHEMNGDAVITAVFIGV